MMSKVLPLQAQQGTTRGCFGAPPGLVGSGRAQGRIKGDVGGALGDHGPDVAATLVPRLGTGALAGGDTGLAVSRELDRPHREEFALEELIGPEPRALVAARIRAPLPGRPVPGLLIRVRPRLLRTL